MQNRFINTKEKTMNTIKSILNSVNVTGKVMARSIGVSQPTISLWRTGKIIPRQKILRKLSKIYHIRYDILRDARRNDINVRRLNNGLQPKKSRKLEKPVNNTLHIISVAKMLSKMPSGDAQMAVIIAGAIREVGK